MSTWSRRYGSLLCSCPGHHRPQASAAVAVGRGQTRIERTRQQRHSGSRDASQSVCVQSKSVLYIYLRELVLRGEPRVARRVHDLIPSHKALLQSIDLTRRHELAELLKEATLRRTRDERNSSRRRRCARALRCARLLGPIPQAASMIAGRSAKCSLFPSTPRTRTRTNDGWHKDTGGGVTPSVYRHTLTVPTTERRVVRCKCPPDPDATAPRRNCTTTCSRYISPKFAISARRLHSRRARPARRAP